MSGQSLANAAGKDTRRELDFYPTPSEVTHALLKFLIAGGNLPDGDAAIDFSIWEPACGDGAMSSVLSDYGFYVYSTDLRETGYGVGGVNFLTTEYDCDAVITNPPFNVSEDFIRHALDQAPIVAMLLKSQYWHAKKRAPLFGEHPPAYVLPLTWRQDFMGGSRGGAPTMEVHWTVWIQGVVDTRMRILTKP